MIPKFRKPVSAKDNRFCYWGGRPEKLLPNEAALRLKTGSFLEIAHRPKFTIPRGCKVFTIGSCFARNVEHKLMASGVDVVSRGMLVPTETYRNPLADPNSATNKFTPHSIQHELQRVLVGEFIKDRGLIEADENLWWDPQATNTLSVPLEAAQALRNQIEATITTVRTADVVLMTLGLTETWFDSQTGIFLNLFPPKLIQLRYPSRFQFANISHDEAVEALSGTFELIRAYGRPDVKIILTVSPVPLNQTFTGDDIVVANTYSKATLRSAVATFADSPDVDYFPAFEMVTMSPRELAWEADQRHATDAMVGHVTDYFVSQYLM